MGIKERQERDRENVHRAILDAARELFVSEGYQNVSIRKIAERIEYSPAAIYGYFPSKDDIFYALAEEGFRLLADLPPAERERRRTLAPLERVRAAFLHIYEFSCEQPQYFALMFLDRSVPRISREYERFAFVQATKQQMVEDLQRCIDSGIFPPAVRAAVAFRLLSMAMIGVAVMRLSQRMTEADDADALAGDMLNVALAGLKSGVELQSRATMPCASDGIPAEHSQTQNEKEQEGVVR